MLVLIWFCRKTPSDWLMSSIAAVSVPFTNEVTGMPRVMNW